MRDSAQTKNYVGPESAAGRLLPIDGRSSRLGELLDQFRAYLLAIAAEELPTQLRGKLGISDLVQETIIRGYQGFGGFRGQTLDELAGWLRTILINHLANTSRAFATDRRAVTREERLEGPIADAGLVAFNSDARTREQLDLIDSALKRLPEGYREVIVLRHREGLSFGEIGVRLKKTEDAARKQWSRAIQSLQAMLPDTC